MFRVNLNDDNFDETVINILLDDEKNIIYLGNNKYITYHSYLDFIKVKTSYIVDECQMKNDIKDTVNVWNNNTFINKERWNFLYSDNDNFIDYLRKLNLDRIFIVGELSSELYNYINVYGNNFETIKIDYDIKRIRQLVDNGEFVLDTSLNSLKLKEIVFGNNYISLTKLCENVDFFYFVNKFSKTNDVTVFEFPDNRDINTFTSKEKERIDKKVNYIFYLNEYGKNQEITNLLDNIYGKDFMNRFSGLNNISPGTIIQNGVCRLADSNNDFCKTINGKRVTTDKIKNYAFDINFLGPCMIYGVLVDDKHTIPSYLQRIINDNNKDYSVNNYGLRAMEFFEQVRIADSISLKQNDKYIFIVSKSENEKLRNMGFYKTISLLPVFNDNDLHDYFIDSPAHCNNKANEKIANYIYKMIKKELIDVCDNNKNLAVPIASSRKRNVFSNNKFLKEYLEMLKSLNINTVNNGAILMNCNPFTYGHYNLINYARSQVETLIVIVVEEDKSEFSFEDRFKMVKDGCSLFNNVVVIPSGKIFGSSMIFPEYFNRSEQTKVSLDLSLDLEIFTKFIAPALNIKKRFVGEEKRDYITREYNNELKRALPLCGIELIELPRFKNKIGIEISAKEVRKAIQDGKSDLLLDLVPQSTLKLIKKKYQ